MATKSLTFDVYGRDKSASSTIRGVRDEAEGLGKTFKRMGPIIAAGFAVAAAGAVRFAGDAVDAASDASVIWKKTEKLFGENAKEIDAWSKTAATKFGISGRAAMGAAADFGNMYLQLGVAADQAADMSTKTVELAADLAAFNGLDTATVVEMIGAAFRGEYDSLQRLVPNINAARVETEALAMTGKTNASELTAQEKAMATLAIVTGDGASAIGAAGDYAETAAGKAATLNAKWEDMQAAVGEKLLTPLGNILGTLEESGAVEDMGTAIGDVAQGFADLEENTGWFSDFIEDMSGFTDFVDDLERAGEALGSGNFDKMSEWSGDTFGEGGLMGSLFGAAGPDGGKSLLQWVTDLPGMWASAFDQAATETESGMERVRGGMGGGFSAMGMDMDTFRSATGEKIGGTWTDADGATRSGVGTVASSTGNGLLDVLGRVLGFSGQVTPQFGSAWSGADQATGAGWGNIERTTGAGVGRVGAKVGEIPGVVKSPFNNSGNWLVDAGENIVEGLINGIRGMIGDAAQTAAKMAAATVKAAKDALGIHSPSTVFRDIGMNVGAGYDEGLEAAMASSHAKIEALVMPASIPQPAAQPAVAPTENNFYLTMQPMRDPDPSTTATIIGREFGRRAAGRAG